ncbi:MAG: FMN-binding protein [Oscillospiraceae bacterium]|nr:FMN-binding protein [Oscillospiraceae bacterium]
MKKVLSWALILSLCLCLLSASALADGTYTPGTYTGESSGHDAGLTVTVTVDENSITDVKVDVSNETPEIGGKAGPKLEAQILEAQSTEIDGVTGATETSDGACRALSAALAQAQGNTPGSEKEPVQDGTFTGTAPGFGLTGQMTCEVTFKDGAITDIQVVEETDSATGEWFANAEELLIPRLLEAQSLGVDAITGATASSNGIKNCVARAIDAAGGKSNQWYLPVEKSKETVTIEDYDVIVVGLGGSGVLSYCAAADQGASVFGIEAAGKIGGNSVCTYGPMALNSEYLKNLFNDGKDYINPDEVYDVWIDYVGSEDKADIIHEAVYSSGTSLDYYVENFGFEFEGRGLLGSFVVPSWDKEWCVYSADPVTGWNILGPNKTFQFTRAMELAKSKNEKNDFMTELRAEKLIFDDAGKVIGVEARYYDGTTYEIYGDTVILATGGFMGDPEMMLEVYGSTINYMGDTVNDGTGIRMGQSAGGATYALKTMPMVHISQVANLIRTDDLTPDQKAVLTALALTTDVPEVTTEGEAWGNTNLSGTVDEKVSVEIVFAPNFMYYNIYTQDDIDNIRENGLSEAQAGATSMFLSQGGTLPEAGTPVADIDEILAVGAEFGDVLIAENLKALAAAIGCDEQTLSDTLGGVDTVYYAVPCTSWCYGTVGGLDVDINMNVLREDGTPIENLFAVGQDSEGVCNVDGKAYTPWGGQAQSWTFVSGKIAGTAAAAYAAK